MRLAVRGGTICMQLAVTQVQFACEWRLIGYNLHATGNHLVQDKRQAEKSWGKGRL
jgi:hypothetical protein